MSGLCRQVLGLSYNCDGDRNDVHSSQFLLLEGLGIDKQSQAFKVRLDSFIHHPDLYIRWPIQISPVPAHKVRDAFHEFHLRCLVSDQGIFIYS